jgi:hypothetical protein
MSDNREVSVSREWLVDFMSVVTQQMLPWNYTGVTTTISIVFCVLFLLWSWSE